MILVLFACDSVAPPSADTDVPPTPVELGTTLSWIEGAVCEGDRTQERFSLYADEAWTSQHATDGNSRFMIGAGVGAADLNDDGYLDILVPKHGEVSLWWGGPDGPEDEWLLAADGEYTAAVPVDYDGDGDLDVYLSRYDGPDQLLRNDPSTGFVDVAAAAGLGDQSYGMGSSWADIDGDGDLDLLALKHGNWIEEHSEISRIYSSNGDGTFEDVTLQHFSGHQGYGHTLAGGFLDLDADGMPEIYLVNDYGWILPNQMFWNRPEGFVQADATLGLDRRMCGMGLAEADIDGDHIPDLFHSSWLELRMLATAGTPRWNDFTVVAGFDIEKHLNRHVAWGADFGDVDNDGDDDLWLGFGAIYANLENPAAQPDALYAREGLGFVERSLYFGLTDLRQTRGGMLVDIDGDGWLDLLKRNKDLPPVLAFGTCGEDHWIRVELRDDGPNTRAVGARIRVIDDDQVDHVRWIRAGGRSLASGGPPEAHFGLGSREHITVEVTWPDGEIETFPALAANRRWTLTRNRP